MNSEQERRAIELIGAILAISIIVTIGLALMVKAVESGVL